jgi:hypothetical protein
MEHTVPSTASEEHVAPYLVHGTVLDIQKAVPVLGAFLQNLRILNRRPGFPGLFVFRPTILLAEIPIERSGSRSL